MKTKFLINPNITFLNHGSFGATPVPVFEEYQRWQRELEYQPVEFLGRKAPELLSESREKLALYLGTHRDNLVYVTNATVGLNIVARSLCLKPGDEVLTSDHEYGALDRTWNFLSQKLGFSYINRHISIPMTNTVDWIEDFWKGVTNQTKVIFLSHITSPTAVIFPIKPICKMAKEKGILTVIDGAHAPGQIDLDLDDLGADFYSGNLHKWLCAPKGSAFLFARPEVQHLIEPLVVSWGWHSENPGPSPFVDILEWQGTRDFAAFLSVPAALKFLNEQDWSTRRAECHALASRLRNRIESITELPGLHPDSDIWYAQMGSMPLPYHANCQMLKETLFHKYQIEIPIHDWNGYKLIRFSIQAYNTEEDVNILLRALQSELYH